MKTMKCIYCNDLTENHKIGAQKIIEGKVVTLNNAPVHYCRKCNETFLSPEAMKVFDYIKDLRLSYKRILFDFEEVNCKMDKKNSVV